MCCVTSKCAPRSSRARPRGDAEFMRFAADARDAGVPVYLVGRGDTLRFGAVALEVLWPPRRRRGRKLAFR